MLRRFSVFSLAFLLCLSLFPARALADVGNASVLWSGSIDDGARFGAFVKGGTCYDAAAASLGYDSSRFSDEVKSKLTDPGYGGMFYTFANAFSRVSSPIEIPSWVPVFVTTSSVIADLLNNISGENYPHWSVAVSYSVYELALRDLLVVLNGGGGSSGGGSSPSSVPSGRYYELDLTDNISSSPADFPVDKIYYSVDLYELEASHITGVTLYTYVLSRSTSTANTQYVFGMAWASTASANANNLYMTNHFYNRNELSLVSGRALYLWSGSDSVNWGGGMGSNNYYNIHVFTLYQFDPNNTPVVTIGHPSGDWPEPDIPVTPTAPELPEPATPTVETPVTPTVPAPVWPDITINIEPDPTPGTTPSGLDYTELLTRINDNLISIDSFARAINSNLNSLRSDLLAEFNGVIDSLRNVYNYLLTIDSVLETHCTHLRNKIEQSAVFIANYMRTLIKWLADQLDFDDLTNVEAPDNSLLTTINEKLGGGTYEPNPIKDESAYYEWLDDLWDRFLLGDNWQSSMGSISGSFSELKTRFPFSVPWDIVALFRLFVHDPVTPVFDLPLYFSPDGSTPVHVDLSPWDSVASLVRPMIFVIFALKLALLSRDLLGGLGADKGGL